MGGGIISLVANGAQDVYLTGSPQITYFKVIYRRYTNFAMETIEQSLDSARPGGTYSVQVQRNGDLATKTALRIKVPALTTSHVAAGAKIAWVRRLGHALVNSVEVKIGGMTIDKHIGTWLDIFYELTHTCEQERGYRALIGDVEELTTLSGRVGDLTTVIPEYTLYIPLQFWFCRNYGLALPLIALQYHEVRIDIALNDMSMLLCWSGSAPTVNNFQFTNAGLMIDYVYLESGERRKYAQLGHEYLIEQVQNTGAESVQAFGNTGSASTNQKFKLNYNHPTKELVWALRVGAFNGEGNRSSYSGGRGKFLAYVNDDADWAKVAVDNAAKNLAESCVQVLATGSTKTAISSSHDILGGSTNDASGSTALPDAGRNAGHRVQVKVINRQIGAATTGSGSEMINERGLASVNVLNTSYDDIADFALLVKSGYDLSDAIDYAAVTVYHTDGANIVIECTEVRHSLNLTDISVPIEDFTTDNRVTVAQNEGARAHQDVTVVQFNNYGLRLDGKGNPVQAGCLQLNGHDRFKEQQGSYFNYYQTQNHHTRTPADGINVYSFALHPEKHQPSGTTNLSRIDSTLLSLTFADVLRPQGSGRIPLDVTTNSILNIFAFSYNVLRVMSGMAGLAYSN